MNQIAHLYVHVPFCPTICPYCDFHVLERRAGMVEAYLLKLEQEAELLAATFAAQAAPLETIYFGGGTPSFLRESEIERLVGSIKRHFSWASLEATLEVNPGTVNAVRAQHWRELGFDRASLGVQSLQDHVLRFLGRTHNAKQAVQAIETLLAAGFRLSADAITAVPGQDIFKDLNDLASFGLEHLSAYTLTIEDGTPFARQGVRVRPEDEERALELAQGVLETHGLQRYEISNHAKPGHESRHNLAYWHNRFWYGLGPSATGHHPSNQAGLISERRKNPNLHAWLKGEQASIANGLLEPVNALEFVTDTLFAGLRLKAGVDLQTLSERAGLDVSTHFQNQIEKLTQQGWLELDAQTLRATNAGSWVLNQVIAEFL